MPGNKPNLTQERRILEVLQDAAGAWVNGQHFLRELYLSQYHRAIWNLQHHRERYGYGGEIEASDFTDAHGASDHVRSKKRAGNAYYGPGQEGRKAGGMVIRVLASNCRGMIKLFYGSTQHNTHTERVV